MNGRITFGEFMSNEYFDFTNVDYYDIILGTPFLKKWGISLDFSSQGGVRIERRLVPQAKPVKLAETLNAINTCAECTTSQ